MERIYQYRMTTTSGGNLSVRDEAGDVWITPARLDKGSLRRDDIVCVRANGRRIDGLHRASSESPFHQEIYRARPDLFAILHAHPAALVAFSICRRVPDTRLFPQAGHVCGTVGLAPYALPGSAQLGQNIAAVFRQGFACVLLENHGVVTGGADLAEAFQRFETLELTAQTILQASLLGQPRYLSAEQLALAQTWPASLPEFVPGPASTAEKELRRSLCQLVRRGYRQRLLTSTEGSFSARLEGSSFLITSYGIDRHAVTPEQLTLIDAGRREAGKHPSRAAQLHQAIYERHPQVQAIVNALPVHATAFSVTATALDSRTIPESYLLLRDVAMLPYGWQYQECDRIAGTVSLERPVALLESDGVLVLGTSALDAFDRLEVLEATAESLIRCRALGAVQRMSEETIAELVQAFLQPGPS
jgi:L-fuculose-phosphate aldolase